MSVLTPWTSTNYHFFLPELLFRKLLYRHLSLNLSKTNIPFIPTCSCYGVPSFEERHAHTRTLSQHHKKSDSESCGFRQLSLYPFEMSLQTTLLPSSSNHLSSDILQMPNHLLCGILQLSSPSLPMSSVSHVQLPQWHRSYDSSPDLSLNFQHPPLG